MTIRILLAAGLLGLGLTSVRAETEIERGAYLTRNVTHCGACHTADAPDAPELAGGRRMSTILYTALPSNLTPDKEFGLANWSDDELVAGIRNGKRPRGSTIGWPMPIDAYAHLSDADTRAIVAFLRSLPPVAKKVNRSTYRKPLPESYGPTVVSVPAAPVSDRLATGHYLARIAGCLHCHSSPRQDGTTNETDGLAAGGREFHGAFGTSLAPALRPAAIGQYSDANLKQIIQTGMRPDGRKLMPPMPTAAFAGIKDADVEAIIAYLRTLKD